MKSLLYNFTGCISFSIYYKWPADSVKNGTDTLPPYLITRHIPTFSMQVSEKDWFHSASVKQNTPTLILYFSPDCGHCQKETEDLLSKVSFLKDLQIVMVQVILIKK
jgi:thiol-disulfide isomerase/thioredoxin